MRALYLVIALAAATMLAAPSAQAFDDPFDDYLQRSDTILLGAGNANDANAAVHTITPWPPYAFHTQIPGDGRRSVDSVERMYRTQNPFERQGSGRPAGASGVGAEAGTGTSLGAGPSPVQPLQSGY